MAIIQITAIYQKLDQLAPLGFVVLLGFVGIMVQLVRVVAMGIMVQPVRMVAVVIVDITEIKVPLVPEELMGGWVRKE